MQSLRTMLVDLDLNISGIEREKEIQYTELHILGSVLRTYKPGDYNNDYTSRSRGGLSSRRASVGLTPNQNANFSLKVHNQAKSSLNNSSQEHKIIEELKGKIKKLEDLNHKQQDIVKIMTKMLAIEDREDDEEYLNLDR